MYGSIYIYLHIYPSTYLSTYLLIYHLYMPPSFYLSVYLFACIYCFTEGFPKSAPFTFKNNTEGSTGAA